MKIKLLLRVLFFAILAAVKMLFGIDWAIVVAAVIIVGDLDDIADSIDKVFKKDC